MRVKSRAPAHSGLALLPSPFRALAPQAAKPLALGGQSGTDPGRPLAQSASAHPFSFSALAHAYLIPSPDAPGLGTLANPRGLPYGDEYKVVNTLQKLTTKALTAFLDTSPNWAEFVSEINANRPLISFIPGHSRSVAGYSETSLFGWFIYQGLLVYDPWPPTSGVITRYENFATQTYRDTFTAHLTLV